MSKTRNWRLVNWRLQIANLQPLLPKKHRLWGEILVIGTAVAVTLWFLFLAVNRLAYPYDLDFIEDAMLMQAWRTAVRLPVYLPPNADYVPQVYMPLYTWLGGLLLRLTGPALWPLRLISLLSTLGTAVLLTCITRKEQTGWAAALASGALFLAGYKLVGGWLDLARVDALFTFLTLAGMGTAVYAHRTRRGLALAGLLMGLSFLTKQNGLFLSIVVGGWLLLAAGWRVRWFVAAWLGMTAVPLLWLQAATDGWFATTVFGIAYASPVDVRRVWPILRREFLGGMGGLFVMMVGSLFLEIRDWRLETGEMRLHNLQSTSLQSPSFAWLVFLGAAVFVSLAGRASVGGNLNNLIIGYALLCLSPGLLAGRWRRRSVILLLILLQFGLSLRPPLPYAPERFLPTADMRANGDRLVAYLAGIDGEVLVMLHPHYAQLAGKTPGVHIQTLWHARWRGQAPLPADLVARIENRAYAVIISDETVYFETEPALVALIEAHYRREPLPQSLSPPTLSGIAARPLVVYRPR